MRYLLAIAVLFLLLTADDQAGTAQATVPSQSTAAETNCAGGRVQNASPNQLEKESNRTTRQLALQAQTDRLVAMATELKDQVDRTNKNILSIKVVRKAEEIEQFARQMKGQGKK